MQVKSSFNFRGETHFEFVERIVALETTVRPLLSVHGHIRVLTGDRMAIAIALLLGGAISESFSVGRPISLRTASGLRRFLDNDELDIIGTTAVPLAVHSGSVELCIVDENIAELKDPEQADRRRLLFQELPSHSNSGRLFAFDKLMVSSNTWLFSSSFGHADRKLETSLVVPLLMAQDLSVSKFSVPRSYIEGRNPADVDAIARLLTSTDIRLSIEGGEYIGN